MNLHQLRVFLVLADTLHFGRAAQQLSVSQPSVSRVLSALERHVGAELFDRTSRDIRLTPAGQGFLKPARVAAQQAELAVRAARSGIADGIESLRIGLMMGAAQPPVGALVRRFKDRHPETRVSFHHCDESTLAKQLTDSRIDVAVAWESSVSTGLFRRRLFEVPLVFVLPTGHRLARQKAVSLNDVRDEQMILPARELQPVIYETYHKMTRAAGFEPKVSIEVLTTAEVLALVAAGAGIGNAAIVPGLRYPGVVVRPNSPAYMLAYELSWLDDSAAVRELLAVV